MHESGLQRFVKALCPVRYFLVYDSKFQVFGIITDGQIEASALQNGEEEQEDDSAEKCGLVNVFIIFNNKSYFITRVVESAVARF